MKPALKNSPLQGMPDKEADFLINNAVSIARRSDGSLENILQGVADFRKDLGYGWEEAVLTQVWYRWPSEIQDQIFCSEKALTSYLLLNTLGIKARYAVLPDYAGSGLNHEVILVKKDNDFLMLDWQHVLPTEVNGNNVKVEGHEYKDVLWIPDEEVIPRVLASRSGEKFMEAIKCGQMLFRKETAEGELDAYVQFNEDDMELKLVYIFRSACNVPAFYCDQRFAATENGIEHKCKLGVVTEDKGLKSKVMEYLNFETDPIASLTEEDRRDVHLFVAYDRETESTGDPIYWMPDEERTEKLDMYRNKGLNPECDADIVLAELPKAYDGLTKLAGKRFADRFVDFELFRLGFIANYDSDADINQEVRRCVGINNNFHLQLMHVAICCREMAKVMSYDTSLRCQELLYRQLSVKTGVWYSGIEPSASVNLIKAFQGEDTNVWNH